MESSKLIFVLLIIGVAIVLSQGTSLSRASFGETCSRSNRCDSRSALACTENVCQCVKPDEMMYDKNKGKCVVLSGERCSYTAVEIVVDQTQEKRWNERLDCVDNAVCNNEGYCDCNSAHYENLEGSCSPKQLHGQNCTKDNECRKDKNLICLNGLCSCNQTEAVFDPAFKVCVARAGSSCMKYDRCVRNANCPRNSGNYYYSDEEDYDLCSCPPEYKKSKRGLCLAKYGMTCDVKSAPCTEEFACIDGKCDCHFPKSQQYYSSSISQCVSFVGGPCFEQIENNTLQLTCVSNAECKNLNGLPECLCKDGYIESERRMCSIAYGRSCGVSSESCDKVANLVCKNGVCICPGFQTYDTTKLKCRGLVGAGCNLDEIDSCVAGATCENFRDHTIKKGICRCMPPFIPNSSRQCSSMKLIEKINLIDVSNGTSESVEDIEILALADSTST